MVKNIFAGILIVGLTSTTVANATMSKGYMLKDYKKTGFVTDCVLFESFNCRNTQDAKIGANLKLQNLARLLLSKSIFSSCNKRSLAKINESCLLTWQGKDEKKSSPKLIQYNENRDREVIDNLDTKFPHLSRSSLVLASPIQNNTEQRLANPAPATKRIASPFGWRRRPYSNQLQFHQGIDYGAPLSSSVVSVGNGIVTKINSGCPDFSNLFCGGQLGNWIEIDHGNGAIAIYGHLKHNSLNVKQGMRVRKNQQIAQVGSSGWSTGAHLDFRIKVHGEYADPATLVMTIKTK